jgi:RNA polymerase sigma-70 factor (ECF subfamily)
LTSDTAEKAVMKNTSTNFVEGLQAGNRSVFRDLFDKYYEPLSRYCMRFVSDQEDAEEIVQDVFVTLWEKRNQLQIYSSLNAYLYQSVKNKALNFKSHLDVRQAYSDHVKATSLNSNVSDDFAEQELSTMIETTLANMPEKRRIVFQMSRYEGLKYAEIADKLEISIKTVEAHLSKALEDLREKLQDYLP